MATHIGYRKVDTPYGTGAALVMKDDGAPVCVWHTHGSVIWPLDADGQDGRMSSAYEHPDGLVISLADAKEAGILEIL